MSKREAPSGKREPSASQAATGRAPLSAGPLFDHVTKLHLFQGIVQRQITVSDPGDMLEREADEIADKVVARPMAPPPPDDQGGGAAPSEREPRRKSDVSSRIQRQADEPRAPEAPSDDSLMRRIESARTAGRALPPSVRREMEAGFGADFSQVRVHTDHEAGRLSRDIGARAFTLGSNIFFGRDQFAPDSMPGKHLLAHELTHTIQQGASKPLRGSRAGVLNTSTGARAGLRPAERGVQALPVVTAVVAPGEIGVKKSIKVSATLAGAGAVTWNLVGAPAGITITPAGKKATIKAGPAASVAAGGTFKAQAKLKKTPADTAISANILIVDVTGITFAAAPVFAKQPIAGGGFAVPPAGTADPNRDGYGANTAVATAVTVPAARPATFALLPGGAVGGAAVAKNVITPGANTGFINVKASDAATGAFIVKKLVVNPVPVKLIGLAQTAKFMPASYGAQNKLTFKSSDTTVNPLNRVVGETITVQQDPFGIVINPPGGPNPAPIAGLAVPANAWKDNLRTPLLRGAGLAVPGVVAGQDPLDLNNYLGPGAASTLPRVWILRQGFHHQSWAGFWSNEFDNGIHRRSLLKTGAAFFFRTEQIFPGAVAKVQNDPYAGPKLIKLTAPTVTPNVPAATGLAADGVATAQVTVATTVPGRNVNWLANGPIAFTVPAAGKSGAVAAPAVVQAGLVPGKFPIQVVDSVFVNREVKGHVKVVPVQLKNIAAAPKNVPIGVLVTTVNVDAHPGGRVLLPNVDPAAAAAGVVAVNVPPAVAKLPLRQVTVTRPAAFTGFVTVTLRDSIRPGKVASIKVKFL